MLSGFRRRWVRWAPMVLAMVFCGSWMPAAGWADGTVPTHSCTQPVKRPTYNSRAHAEIFRKEAEAYKQCLSRFIDEQKAAVKNHEQAANKAIEEWNAFTKILAGP